MNIARGMLISVLLTAGLLLVTLWGNLYFYTSGVKHLSGECKPEDLIKCVLKITEPLGVAHINTMTLDISMEGNINSAEFLCEKTRYNLLEKYLFYTGKYALRVIYDCGNFTSVTREEISSPAIPPYFSRTIKTGRIAENLVSEEKDDIIAVVDLNNGLVKVMSGEKRLMPLGDVI